jgi:flagellar hook-associated protein 1 FlgK
LSDFSDLTVGLSGLEAQQTAMDTVGQNVANASTPGYVDEEVQLGSVGAVQHMGFDDSASPLPGDGVEVAGIERLSNQYLQQQSYTEQANQGTLTAQQAGLQSIQGNFPEPSTTGISSQLTQFWQDWSTLANNPSDEATRATLVQDAGSLTSSLNQTSTALTTLSQQTVQSMTSTLGQVNQDAAQIASLNQQMLGTSANSSSGDSLADQRDELISQLSTQLGVNVTYNADGTANVYSGSEALVSGPQLPDAVLVEQRASLFVGVEPGPDELPAQQRGPGGGPERGQPVRPGLPAEPGPGGPEPHGLRQQLGEHRLRPERQPRAPLSSSAPVPRTSRSTRPWRPTPALIAAASAPVASGSSATNEDGTIAADIGELPNSQTVTLDVPSGGWSAGASASSWSGATTTTGTEADTAYNELVTGIGQATSTVNNSLTNQQTVTTNVNSALQSATGVNTDQEMTNMVMYQNAYDASAKFISTVDAVLQTLVSMVNS